MNIKTHRNTLSAAALILGVVSINATAASVSWDGGAGDGLWTSATNWSNDLVPGVGDDVTINSAAVTWDVAANSGNFDGTSLALTGASTLTANTVFRANGATIDLGSQSTLSSSGGLQFFDWNNASVTINSGAQVTGSVAWEHKGTNVFAFNLEASGFTTLTPAFLNVSGANFATTTYTVDLQNYTGGAGSITLVDFGGEFGDNLTDATFQTSTHNIINAGAFTGSTLTYNDADDAIVLNVIVPEPSSMLLLGLAGLGLTCRRRR